LCVAGYVVIGKLSKTANLRIAKYGFRPAAQNAAERISGLQIRPT